MTPSRRLQACVAAVCLALSGVWTGVSGAAVAAGVSDARAWCGALPADPAVAAMLADVLGAQDQPAADPPSDCPGCLAALSTPATPVGAPSRRAVPMSVSKPDDRAANACPRGPPLGGRAPPFHSFA